MQDDPQTRHQTYRQLTQELIRLVERNAPRSELVRIAKYATAQFKAERAPEQLEVLSSVSAKTLEPFITIRWGDLEAQLDADRAHQHSRYVIECIEAAVTDAFMTRFFREKLEAPDEMIKLMLLELRGYRAALAERQS